jgi:hypothetical protein
VGVEKVDPVVQAQIIVVLMERKGLLVIVMVPHGAWKGMNVVTPGTDREDALQQTNVIGPKRKIEPQAPTIAIR